jgi:DNA mismatch endonuclease (patch repair protein)
MSRIRGKGNRETELRMIDILRANHLAGWRRNQPVLGKPDFIFPKQHVALFVDGCFWHSCPRHSNLPRNNRAFWRKKLEANRARDTYVSRLLRRQGWAVLRVWEHDLQQPARIVAKLSRYLSTS